MKKQFVQPWAEMYKVHHRHVIATSPQSDLTVDPNGTPVTTPEDVDAAVRLGVFGSTPTVIYGDDYE